MVHQYTSHHKSTLDLPYLDQTFTDPSVSSPTSKSDSGIRSLGCKHQHGIPALSRCKVKLSRPQKDLKNLPQDPPVGVSIYSPLAVNRP